MCFVLCLFFLFFCLTSLPVPKLSFFCQTALLDSFQAVSNLIVVCLYMCVHLSFLTLKSPPGCTMPWATAKVPTRLVQQPVNSLMDYFYWTFLLDKSTNSLFNKKKINKKKNKKNKKQEKKRQGKREKSASSVYENRLSIC